MSENKHSSYDLAQMQSLPLSAKIVMTKQRIRQWYDYYDGDVYVAFSGGKDSTVLKHIIDSMYSDVPAVFVNTGLEYPEIQHFVNDVKRGKYECFNSDITILHPKMRFDEVIKKYGYPFPSKEVSRKIYDVKRQAAIHGLEPRQTTMYKYYFKKSDRTTMFNHEKWQWLLDAPFDVGANCCDIMKKRPLHQYRKETGREAYLATMAQESLLRKNAWIRNGCNAFEAKIPHSTPMAFWTEQDVLEYIVQYNVPYCLEIYGHIVVDGECDGQEYLDCIHPKLKLTGATRTGCMFCMYGVHLEKEPNRFQRMKVTHPKQWEYCMKDVEEGGLGLRKVLDYVGVKYE